jgi:hypothetical protein
MDREYDDRLDRPSAVRAGNALLREAIASAANAVKNYDWVRAENQYQEIEMLASSLRNSAQANYHKFGIKKEASE